MNNISDKTLSQKIERTETRTNAVFVEASGEMDEVKNLNSKCYDC